MEVVRRRSLVTGLPLHLMDKFDKFDEAEAMTPADWEPHFEKSIVTNWEQLPKGSHEAAQAIAARLERLAGQS